MHPNDFNTLTELRKSNRSVLIVLDKSILIKETKESAKDFLKMISNLIKKHVDYLKKKELKSFVLMTMDQGILVEVNSENP